MPSNKTLRSIVRKASPLVQHPTPNHRTEVVVTDDRVAIRITGNVDALSRDDALKIAYSIMSLAAKLV